MACACVCTSVHVRISACAYFCRCKCVCACVHVCLCNLCVYVRARESAATVCVIPPHPISEANCIWPARISLDVFACECSANAPSLPEVSAILMAVLAIFVTVLPTHIFVTNSLSLSPSSSCPKLPSPVFLILLLSLCTHRWQWKQFNAREEKRFSEAIFPPSPVRCP